MSLELEKMISHIEDTRPTMYGHSVVVCKCEFLVCWTARNSTVLVCGQCMCIVAAGQKLPVLESPLNCAVTSDSLLSLLHFTVIKQTQQNTD